jgi:hypothetical protein
MIALDSLPSLSPKQNCQMILQVIDAALSIVDLENDAAAGNDDDDFVDSDNGKLNGERC